MKLRTACWTALLHLNQRHGHPRKPVPDLGWTGEKFPFPLNLLHEKMSGVGQSCAVLQQDGLHLPWTFVTQWRTKCLECQKLASSLWHELDPFIQQPQRHFDTCIVHSFLFIIQPTNGQIILNIISIWITGSYMFRHTIRHLQAAYSVTLPNYIYKYSSC